MLDVAKPFNDLARIVLMGLPMKMGICGYSSIYSEVTTDLKPNDFWFLNICGQARFVQSKRKIEI